MSFYEEGNAFRSKTLNVNVNFVCLKENSTGCLMLEHLAITCMF